MPMAKAAPKAASKVKAKAKAKAAPRPLSGWRALQAAIKQGTSASESSASRARSASWGR